MNQRLEILSANTLEIQVKTPDGSWLPCTAEAVWVQNPDDGLPNFTRGGIVVEIAADGKVRATICGHVFSIKEKPA
jgi:hypothetical protein